MYDTGNSMSVLSEALTFMKPKSLAYAILFHKKQTENLEHNFFAKYTGFLVPNHFVIGYGMDFNGLFRDMPHLGIIS